MYEIIMFALSGTVLTLLFVALFYALALLLRVVSGLIWDLKGPRQCVSTNLELVL